MSQSGSFAGSEDIAAFAPVSATTSSDAAMHGAKMAVDSDTATSQEKQHRPIVVRSLTIHSTGDRIVAGDVCRNKSRGSESTGLKVFEVRFHSSKKHQRFWQSAPGDARAQEFVIDFGGERKIASVEIEWEVRTLSGAVS